MASLTPAAQNERDKVIAYIERVAKGHWAKAKWLDDYERPRPKELIAHYQAAGHSLDTVVFALKRGYHRRRALQHKSKADE